MLITLILLLLLVVVFYGFLQQPQFGKAASGKVLERIQQSPNFKNGQFQNLSVTPQLTEGASMTSVMREFFFGKSERRMPPAQLPTRKTDLFSLSPNEDVLVWFGHSSYFLQLDGKKFLVDPVLSGHASPITFTTRSFKGSDVYTTDDIPNIDYLLITHDHYDHLDHQTIVKLQPKIGQVITGLGAGAHLERWGYDPRIIIEKDWNEEEVLDEGFVINTTPGRHFSGRGFKRNISLWLSFVLTTPNYRIFIGGDSGYDTHFATIGDRFGPFDLVILENGQYNKSWKYIHMMPEEVVQAALDLKAKKLLPVHWSKFSLSTHAWDEPIIRVTKEAVKKGVEVVHPMIGEALHVKEATPYAMWWEAVK
jgi:L-ascorbate metabolism protein UlaG (beta-lactamase superfamily)